MTATMHDENLSTQTVGGYVLEEKLPSQATKGHVIP
jgi:hypothetical protein